MITPKQAAFCREYLLDFNGTQAAMRAGYSERTAQEQASRLLSKDMVRSEIARLQEQAAAVANVTLDSLLREVEDARAMARQRENAAAMVAATTLKAKLTGHFIDKTEDMVARERLEAERATLRHARNAGQLLAEAAVSMGLSPNSTPAQIAAKMHTQPFVTPAVYKLIRATGEDEDGARH